MCEIHGGSVRNLRHGAISAPMSFRARRGAAGEESTQAIPIPATPSAKGTLSLP
jgi:hypothetical protein